MVHNPCLFGWLDNTMGNLGKKALIDLTVPSAKDVFPILATRATLAILDKFERKLNGKEL